MTRECHVRFWERAGVKFPGATRFPLYRQAQIMSRQGVDLNHSTGADWVGLAVYELRPAFDALITYLKRSAKLFRDETRAPVLDPGSCKTKTGYFWALGGMIALGAAALHQVWPSATLPVEGAFMPNEYCRAFPASCRSMVMPDSTG